ncbi:hypothetical protein Smp_008390 [Schistosoma mansoni]|uniref:hypothetical protein n=1 Tax=Schistosoma mansoni TaxID=6183 RepID=UPI00022DC7CB|nr:hypothetical protein Smp_008390 [Schistosoma mansoni]|eukprot:XP_018648835.1 hypothetical protein Smp_008390 [Schistosoma mansoni]
MTHSSILFFDFFLYLDPTPPTIATLVPSTSINPGESWPDHTRSSQSTQSMFLACVWTRTWILLSRLVSWLNLVPSYVYSVLWSGPLRTQSSAMPPPMMAMKTIKISSTRGCSRSQRSA